MKSPDQKSRAMALDLGQARVGVAISDPLWITAQPGPTLPRNPREEFLAALDELIRSNEVGTVVVGAPLSLKGQQSGSSFRDAEEFLEVGRSRWPECFWTMVDERFTTTAAARALRSAPKKKREQKGLRDQLAAQLILSTWLEQQNR